MPATTSVTMTHSFDHASGPFVELVIASDTSEARQAQERIEQGLQDQHVPERDIFCIKLALEEAIVNAIKHGNQFDRGKKVRIAYRILADRFEVAVSDDGPGFDPCDVPDPTAVENLERPCGRGLMLMRHYMSQVDYNPRGNGVTMAKVFRSNGRKDR